MKKILKLCCAFVLVFACMFTFTACGTKLSTTTVDVSKVSSSNGETTNGGVTAIYDGYLYFINGIKTNDGKSLKKNTRSAICRVKIDESTGEVDKNTYEVVVGDLAGFNNGSLYFFGDFMYYTTPSSDVNYQANVLYYKTKFMRYDLVNKKSYTLYTTQKNAEKEEITFSYYVTGETLNLLVYEKSSNLITSMKIGNKTTVNYKINDVTGCVMSENFGASVTAGAVVDGNNFVYYTKSHEQYEPLQKGVKVFKVSPNADDSTIISDEGKDVTLLSVRNGKLIYSSESKIYSQTITDSKTEKLSFETGKSISYTTYDDVIFIENKDGSISLLYFNSSYYLCLDKWTETDYAPKTINYFGEGFKDLEFIGTVTMNEEIKNDESEGDGEGETETTGETQIDEVTYLLFINSKKVYKIEVLRNGVVSEYAQPIKLSSTDVEAATGLLVGEVVGNNVYIMAKRLDDNKKVTDFIYLHKIDITATDDCEDKAELIGIIEAGEKTSKDDKK